MGIFFFVPVSFSEFMKSLWLNLLIFLLAAGIVSGQEVVYVNTANLILRDRPEKGYNVFCILQPPCPLKVDKYDDGYKNDKTVTDKFYRVSVSYTDNNGIYHRIGGWVLKKYVVTNLAGVTVPGLNTRSQVEPSAVGLFTEVDVDDGGRFNSALFPSPKYKGGELQPAPPKRVYHKGPRGGCFYIGSKGRKIYVDKNFCIGK